LHWEASLLPQAEIEPSERNPRLCDPPAATAVNPALGAGTALIPKMLFPPNTTIVPSDRFEPGQRRLSDHAHVPPAGDLALGADRIGHEEGDEQRRNGQQCSV
jgi:hypothetical protein